MTLHRRHISRRRFLKGILAAGLFSAFPAVMTCCSEAPRHTSRHGLLAAVADTLFPGFPDIMQIRFLYYYEWTMNDPHFDADIKEILRLGLADFRRYLGEKDFTALAADEREKFLDKYIRHHEGAGAWIGGLLRLIWEAALLDPYYGINTDEVGWKWLHHRPGRPRPEPGTAYEDLLAMRERLEILRSPQDL